MGWDTDLPATYEPDEILSDLLSDFGYDPDNPPEWVSEESEHDYETS